MIKPAQMNIPPNLFSMATCLYKAILGTRNTIFYKKNYQDINTKY